MPDAISYLGPELDELVRWSKDRGGSPVSFCVRAGCVAAIHQNAVSCVSPSTDLHLNARLGNA